MCHPFYAAEYFYVTRRLHALAEARPINHMIHEAPSSKPLREKTTASVPSKWQIHDDRAAYFQRVKRQAHLVLPVEGGEKPPRPAVATEPVERTELRKIRIVLPMRARRHHKRGVGKERPRVGRATDQRNTAGNKKGRRPKQTLESIEHDDSSNGSPLLHYSMQHRTGMRRIAKLALYMVHLPGSSKFPPLPQDMKPNPRTSAAPTQTCTQQCFFPRGARIVSDLTPRVERYTTLCPLRNIIEPDVFSADPPQQSRHVTLFGPLTSRMRVLTHATFSLVAQSGRRWARTAAALMTYEK